MSRIFSMFFALKRIINSIYYTLFSHLVLYPLVSLLPKHFDVGFLNLGYAPLKNEKDEIIEELTAQYLDIQDPIRAHCLLYEKTLSLCPKYPKFPKSTKLLEVGCGLGGGLRWLISAHEELAEIVGMDPILSNTDNHKSMVRALVRGSAEKMPFPAQTFDIVLNVESSHLYLEQRKFFEEANRVLKSGGYLCWADLRHKEKMRDVLINAKECGFDLLDFEEITAQIIQGIHQTSSRYEKMIERVKLFSEQIISTLTKAPWFIRLFKNTFKHVYCAPGTDTYNQYVNGERTYATACWQKSFI